VFEVDEVIAEFLVESHENLDQLDRDLVALEREPGNRDLVASIFRTIHTIKGTCGFLAFHQLEAVTHAGENLLARIRDGRLELDAERANVLLAMVDVVRTLLGEIEATGAEGSHDHSALVARINASMEPSPTPAATTVSATEPVSEMTEADVPSDVDGVHDQQSIDSSTEDNVITSESDESAADDKPKPVAKRASRAKEVKPTESVAAAVPTDIATPSAPAADVQGDDADDHDAAKHDGDGRRSVADSTLRVDVDLLDTLMRLVGELVLTRNQLLANSSSMDAGMIRATQRLNLIASELQEGVMKTRMQPIDNVWSKLPRVVRDLGQQCGREVRLEMIGRDTELDKTILEAVKDPLTHVVRNAVDHGIETPDERVAVGKSREGTLTLRAFHEGGQVNIEISDDGAGIDPDRILAKALERGVVTREAADRLSEREILQLIFAPGFSTKEAVSNVSGRGVGMDVVKTNIENIGGIVDISTELGRGTTIRMKIPLTLAIIPTVTIESGGERFAIPQISLIELVSLNDEQGSAHIEYLSGAPVYRLRGNLLPLIFFNELLSLEDRAVDGRTIAVLQADGQQFGLVVDEVVNTEEIVVKPLSQQLKRISVYSGATILGDGRVALILDVLALAAMSGVLAGDRSALDAGLTDADLDEDEQAHLLVRLGAERRMAIPLGDVTRLEEFRTSSVEHAGRREAVQYRGQILPLIRLSEVFGAMSMPDSDNTMHVVVHTIRGKTIGLVVDEILDITTGPMGAREESTQMGLAGSAVVQERITELLKVAEAVALADPSLADLFESPEVDELPELPEVPPAPHGHGRRRSSHYAGV
jgi:two-component system chemotaxis sensor kinase CheA